MADITLERTIQYPFISEKAFRFILGVTPQFQMPSFEQLSPPVKQAIEEYMKPVLTQEQLKLIENQARNQLFLSAINGLITAFMGGTPQQAIQATAMGATGGITPFAQLLQQSYAQKLAQEEKARQAKLRLAEEEMRYGMEKPLTEWKAKMQRVGTALRGAEGRIVERRQPEEVYETVQAGRTPKLNLYQIWEDAVQMRKNILNTSIKVGDKTLKISEVLTNWQNYSPEERKRINDEIIRRIPELGLIKFIPGDAGGEYPPVIDVMSQSEILQKVQTDPQWAQAVLYKLQTGLFPVGESPTKENVPELRIGEKIFKVQKDYGNYYGASDIVKIIDDQIPKLLQRFPTPPDRQKRESLYRGFLSMMHILLNKISYYDPEELRDPEVIKKVLSEIKNELVGMGATPEEAEKSLNYWFSDVSLIQNFLRKPKHNILEAIATINYLIDGDEVRYKSILEWIKQNKATIDSRGLKGLEPQMEKIFEFKTPQPSTLGYGK